MSDLIRFQHHQSAHCESGVTSNLLRHAGVQISEAMSFGIGSGIFFLHLPWIKVMDIPLTSYRSFPGTIFKKNCRRLGIAYEYRKFRDPIRGARALDDYLRAGRAVGIQANIHWLSYVPEKFRFQFNAHNLVVCARNEDGSYIVSDPVLETTSICPASAMTRARFAKGMLAPKGLIYFPQLQENHTDKLPLENAIRSGLRETLRRMLFSPVPFAGVRGIRFLAGKMRQWPTKYPDLAMRKLHMANVVRMQEEIGTGGAGFRFLYAAFLQESGERLGSQVLKDAARNMTEAGNAWRDFATLAARFCKGTLEQPFEEISDRLLTIADQEQAIYQTLRRHYL
ncbi:MAG: BtrH N-terminal domain-containing protein [Nevskiaceae bacterium]|jgi:hypothetical protein|nr:BtrH N-terminal domain-containing protein [Nevskiaceae bacterium]